MFCGDVVGRVVKCMGMGWGWKKIHGDGTGMGLIFTTVSLFSAVIIVIKTPVHPFVHLDCY